MISCEMLDGLRQRINEAARNGMMSEKRCRHTLEVEKMVQRLGEVYLPEMINSLRAAALLHDVTKEYSFDMQIKLCAELGVEVGETEYYAPKTLHAMTGAAVILRDYPEFATDEIVGYVRWHTTGRRGMTLGERLVYLADYIDMSRTFEDCVALRNYFFGVDIVSMTEEERLDHLDRTLLKSFDMTIKSLLEGTSPISEDTVNARNEIALRLIKKK